MIKPFGSIVAFKQSVAGKIPTHWDADLIENIARVTTGGKNTEDAVPNGRYPFFIRSETVHAIDSYAFDGEAVLTAGDGKAGEIFHYINGKFDAHQRVYCISHFSPRIDGYFFYLYFSQHFYARFMQMTAKSTVDSVRMDMIAKMPFAIPPMEEQKAIARIMSDMDGRLGALRRLIDKKQMVKTAAMQQLLSGNTRIPGFSSKWQQMPLDKIGEIKKGDSLVTSLVQGGNIPVIGGGKEYTCYHDQANRTGKTISIAIIGAYAGCVLFHATPVFATSNCATIEMSDACCAEFLFYQLKSMQQEIYGLQSGSAQPYIHPNDLNGLIIGLPPIEEQRAIAAVLADMDAEIAALKTQLRKTTLLKQSAAQTLLAPAK